MEKVHPDKNISRLKNMAKYVRERAKNHVQRTEMDDLIQKHGTTAAKRMGWLNEDGKKRKKIDD